MMNERIRTLLKDLKGGLGTIYGERLKGVYLYGSYARGEEDSESDVDVLVILDQFNHYGAEVDRTGHLVSALSLKYGVSISIRFAARLVGRRDRLPRERTGGSNPRMKEETQKLLDNDPKFHRWLLDAFDKRIQGDYGVEAVVTSEDVVIMIEQAREFLHEAHRCLGRVS